MQQLLRRFSLAVMSRWPRLGLGLFISTTMWLLVKHRNLLRGDGQNESMDLLKSPSKELFLREQIQPAPKAVANSNFFSGDTMSAKDRLSLLTSSISARLSTAQSAVSDLQTDSDTIAALGTDIDSEKNDYGKAQYNQGWTEALAQSATANASDKIYTEAEMDAELAPLNQQITDLKAQVATAQAAVDQGKADLASAQKQIADAAVSQQQAILQAVQSTKLDIAAKFKAVEVDNDALIATLEQEGAPTATTQSPVNPPEAGTQVDTSASAQAES